MLTTDDLEYFGAFRLPHDIVTTVTPRPNAYPVEGKLKDGFNSGGAPFAFDAVRNEWIIGTRHNRLGRVKVIDPAIVEHVTDLPVAPWVDQQLVDISGNSWNQISDDNGWEHKGQAGVMPWGTAYVIGSGGSSYDANNRQRRGHLLAQWPPKSVQTPQHTPWKTVGNQFMQGLTAGYMCPIPEPWQQRLHGKALTGKGGGSIISGGSTGPAAWAFDPDALLNDGYVDAKLLVGYPNAHPTLGKWGSDQPASELYASATDINGVAIVDDCAVFVGKHGYGQPCYGDGTADPAKVKPGVCFDPTSADKGNHAYPYRYQLWIYSLLDLAAVAAGEREPWSLIPTIATLTVPFIGKQYRVGGIAFDASTRRLSVCVRSADGHGLEPGPVVHVFVVKASTAPPSELELLKAEHADLLKHLDALEAENIAIREAVHLAMADLRFAVEREPEPEP